MGGGESAGIAPARSEYQRKLEALGVRQFDIKSENVNLGSLGAVRDKKRLLAAHDEYGTTLKRARENEDERRQVKAMTFVYMEQDAPIQGECFD